MSESQAPAASYKLIALLLGDEWFTSPAPTVGYRVEVVSLDGVVTVWELDPAHTRSVIDYAKHHPHLAVVNIRGFMREGDPQITTWHAGA